MDYRHTVDVRVAHAIPKHVMVAGACGARAAIKLLPENVTVRTRFVLESDLCVATWRLPAVDGEPSSVTVELRSAGNALLFPYRETVKAGLCEETRYC